MDGFATEHDRGYDRHGTVSSRTTNIDLPLPLAASVGGLGILGIKQLVSGSAALVSGPTAFNLAALVSAASGYPAINKGLRRYANADLILGASALALALLRRNLAVLAGLSLLQYLKWKQSQVPQVQGRNPEPAPEIQSYSERAGRTGLALAGATWAVTGNPGTGLSVLLAGNPRVATLPAQYAWEQAELEAARQGYVVPEGTTVAGLARLSTVVFADTSLFARGEAERLRCVPFRHEEAKLWQMAAP